MTDFLKKKIKKIIRHTKREEKYILPRIKAWIGIRFRYDTFIRNISQGILNKHKRSKVLM